MTFTKTALLLALTTATALSSMAAFARPTHNPPPIRILPPLADVWYCKYQRPGPEAYQFFVEMGPGQACPATYVDGYGISNLVLEFHAPPGGVLVP